MGNIELYELYHNLFLGCLIACIVHAAIAVFIFFALDIRGVIGFLSGRTAKKTDSEDRGGERRRRAALPEKSKESAI